MEQARADDVDRILNSGAHAILVVAGPGTGKSYTLRQLAEATPGQVIALTFLNSLAAGLAQDLGEHADTSTFHKFSKRLLHRSGVQGLTSDFDYYPHLLRLAATDITLIDSPTTEDEIDRALMLLEEASIPLVGILRSGDYYNAVGHNDAVYRLYRNLRDHESAIPTYARLLVDEYQDFSLLEVSLIDLLATKSRIVIVGDDDQAIFKFRHASPSHIRARAADSRFELQQLRYCTRCPSVLVDAVGSVVSKARSVGLLTDRIEGREYICYLPAKEDDSREFPKIKHAEISVHRKDWNYTARYISSRIKAIPEAHFEQAAEAGEPCVLIIGPKPFRDHVFEHIRERFPGVELRASSNQTMDVLDGYRRLMSNPDSRLGWRILLEIRQPEGWTGWVKLAVSCGQELSELIDESFRDLALAAAGILKRAIAGEEISAGEELVLLEHTGRSVDEIVRAMAADDDEEPDESAEPRVLVTTLVGAKGLQAQHTFVVGVNAGHFPQNEPTEQEVCQLLVALTRSRKSCTLVSARRIGNYALGRSPFLDWLEPHLESSYIDKDAIRDIEGNGDT